MPSNTPAGLIDAFKRANQKSLEKAAARRKIDISSIAFFAQNLSALLGGGLTLLSSLEILVDQTEDRYLKIILGWVKEKVASGSALSDALKEHPKAFPSLLISMIQAGEASGALATMMDKVAGYLDSSVKLQKRVKGALAYPVGVIILAFLLVNALMIFVIPQFTQMFSSFGAKLPLPTKILVTASQAVQHYGLFIGAGLVGLIFAIARYFKTPSGRKVKDSIIFHIPIVGRLSQKITISRFCRTYATLLKSGVPVLQSLEICSSASDNTYIEAGSRIIAQNMTEGRLFSEAVRQIPYFPPMVRHMAKAGEQSGNIENMLLKSADFYDTEIDSTVGALTSLMEPFLISFLGIVVGGIAMAIFMPVFQMANLVSS